ncbi:hypothetical protein DL96DRAFT_1573183 [Flagelloscypha sp. PMI_526]|nr:hypothetical protein DL96DRAFT_1573183 [Flagelloscypha sp. PMI_526]
MSFEHARVTQGLMLGLGLTSLLVGLFDIKHYFHLQLTPHISIHHQYWRLFAHHFAFADSSDVFLVEILLFSISAPVERQFGSWKFSSFILLVTLLATILEFLILLGFSGLGFNHIPSGPSPLIFSILYQHTRITPPVYTWKLFGLSLSNDSFHHFLALQLAIMRLPSSLVQCMVGIASGQMYRSDLFNLKEYRISPRVVSSVRTWLLPFLGATRPIRRSNRALPDEPLSRNGGRQGNEEIITTARPSASERASTSLRGRVAAATREVRPSVVRQWVDGIAGPRQLPNGTRLTTEGEVDAVSNMFPELQRDVIVATLQRSVSLQSAVDTLLRGRAAT